MSDFGPSGEDTATRGDVWRYVWLGALGSLVLLLLLSPVEGTLVVFTAVALLALAAAGVAVLRRRSRG